MILVYCFWFILGLMAGFIVAAALALKWLVEPKKGGTK